MPCGATNGFGAAHRIKMRGKSMRKKRNPPLDEKKESVTQISDAGHVELQV